MGITSRLRTVFGSCAPVRLKVSFNLLSDCIQELSPLKSACVGHRTLSRRDMANGKVARVDLLCWRFMMSELLPLIILLASFFVPYSDSSAQSRTASETIQIGHIYYFGYAGLDLKQVQEHLPIHVGDSVNFKTLDHERKLIQNSIREVAGKPATDIAVVCCDEERHLLIYVGLSGKSSRSMARAAAPHGSDRLTPTAFRLYEEETTAIENAVRHGSAREDDSKGYAISDDPSTRRIELAIRVYAAQRGPEIEKVLQNSADPKQREASAFLLGYADRSEVQIQNLFAATNDADEIVANNALRALAVLASAPNAPPLGINPAPLIGLLFSGQWTDRNKSSFLIAQLSRDRDPVLLEQLRERAMPPLIEGAGWDTSHGTCFLQILGRIAGIPESRLDELIEAGDKAQIIRAAEVTKN